MCLLRDPRSGPRSDVDLLGMLEDVGLETGLICKSIAELMKPIGTSTVLVPAQAKQR